MATEDRPTHQTVTEPQPGDGVEISAARASQSYPRSGGSKRTFLVLIASLALVIIVLGIYWAGVAPGLHRVDQPGGHGKLVTDPGVIATYHAPEPAPKEPPVDQIARSSGGGGG
jgi:hypothetical protein